jgi:hypothetical protein
VPAVVPEVEPPDPPGAIGDATVPAPVDIEGPNALPAASWSPPASLSSLGTLFVDAARGSEDPVDSGSFLESSAQAAHASKRARK